MDENKNINNGANEVEFKTTEKAVKVKAKKPKMIKNQALLKRGGYSVAITAFVLAGIIVLNILVGVLSKRFMLEFDMTSEKAYTISEDNLDYIKDLDAKVQITVCADKENYVGGYMSAYAQNLYSVTEDATNYYKQTINLIDKYGEYNDNITVKYVDPQSTEFTEISTQYSNHNLEYGDVVISQSETGRYKIIGFKDIYYLYEDTTYAAYGYTTNRVTGNNVETAVTSAIAYVASGETKKIALLTGHSKTDYTSSYQALLKANNYEITTISDSLISSIDSEFDAVIISAPTIDFIGSELDVISDFLENDGKLGKGLIFFADATAPYLTNLYDYLEQWGISVEEGILFETNSSYCLPEDPTTMGSFPSVKDDITEGVKLFITGYNVPLTTAFESEGDIEVLSISETSGTVVAAPIGISSDWNGASDYKKQSYSTSIISTKTSYDGDNNEVSSHVMAFGSIEFIYSDYVEQSAVGNKELSLNFAERAVNMEDNGISFVTKTITNESFSSSVTAAKTNTIKLVFMILLPLASVIVGIYIFVRRKNS